MENNTIALIKAELIAMKLFITEELYSLSWIMDQIRTEYKQSKILKNNDYLRGKISSEDQAFQWTFCARVTNCFYSEIFSK